MNWRRALGKPARNATTETSEQREHADIDEVEARLREIEERANRVAPRLEGRKRRNHWTETVQGIARGEA